MLYDELGEATARDSAVRRGADVGEVVLNFHIPVRVSLRLPGTPPFICSSPNRRTPRWASAGALRHALSDANDDDTITFAVAGTNR